MKTLSLSDNQLHTDTRGNLAIKSDHDAVIQNCETAMKTLTGEMIYNMTRGIPWKITVWNRYNPRQFEAAARALLLSVEGVTGITAFSVSRNGDVLNYEARIRTQYSSEEVKISG